MSFWSDASPIVKGAIVVGVVGAVYLLTARVAGFVPFTPETGEAEGTSQRGLPPGGNPAAGGEAH